MANSNSEAASTPAPSARCTGRRWSACRCAPAGSRAGRVRSAGSIEASVCFIQFLSSRSGKSSRAWAPRDSVRLAAESIVTTAWTIRLSYSSVSIEVGVPDQRAVGDADVVGPGPDLVDALVAFGEHLAGAEHGAVLLHHLLHAQAELGGRRAAVGVAEAVEAGDGIVAGVLRQVAMLVAGSIVSRQRAAPRRGRRRRGRSANSSRGGWRRAPRRRPPRRSPSGRGRRCRDRRWPWSAPRRDSSSGCRPCCSGPSAAPGSARG